MSGARRMKGGFNNFGYEYRQQSTNVAGEYKMGRPLNPNMFQYPPKSFSTDLSQGILQFDFSVSPDSEWIPSKSYFMIRTKLTVAGPVVEGTKTSRSPLPGDNICYSNFAAGQLFTDMQFQMANRTISIQNTACPHVYSLMNRMAYGGGFLENNRDIFYYYPDIEDRINDVTLGSGSSNSFDVINTAIITYTAATNVLSISNTDKHFNDMNIVNGDIIVYTESSGKTTSFTVVNTVLEGGVNNLVVKSPIAVNLAGSVLKHWSIVRVSNSSTLESRSEKLFTYQPSIGLFQLSTGISCNSMSLILNPYADWYNRAVQQLYPRLADDAGDAGVERVFDPRTYSSIEGTLNTYTISVKSIQFYAYIQARTTPMPKQLTLKTLEATISRETLLASQSITKQYSIPASTKYIAVFFQDAAGVDPGRNVYVPECAPNTGLIGTPLNCSDFRTVDNLSSTLETLSIQLGDIKVPQSEYSQTATGVIKGVAVSNMNAYSNGQIQRYIDTQNVTAKFFSDAGSESFDNFIKSPFYLFNVEQPKDSWNTAMFLRATFGSKPKAASTSAGQAGAENINLFVISFHEKVAVLTQEGGLITSVEQSEV
jgi:hypothetical protein